MTGPSSPDGGLGAALVQLGDHRERLTRLDSKISDLNTQLSGIRNTLRGQAKALAALDRLEKTIAALAVQLASQSGQEPPAAGYQVIPVIRWWSITGDDRAQAVIRLHGWVEAVLRPVYGHLAAQLRPCWEHHPLCLQTLDWVVELFNVLYLNKTRNLNGHAEFGTRILPAALALLAEETETCQHGCRLTPQARPR